MKRFSEQLHKKALTVKLRVAERRELRERVVSYMEYHPLPAKMREVSDNSILMTEEYKEVAVPWKMLGRWAVGAFAIILVAVPFVAERSVPGDNLYALKRFNEEVRGTLAFDTVQKVEWETERLNRRIAEARLLASEGRLTDEVEAEVAEAVRTHSENAQKNIEVLRGEDADEATMAAIAFETTLSVQSVALQDKKEIDEQGEAVAPKTPLLATAVEESRVKSNANNASSTIPAFDKLMAKVEQNTTRVYELLDSLSETASKEEIAEITRRIQDIERSVQKAVNLRQENDAEARGLLVSSLQRTQKLIVFMTDIEVSETVDIETIVPVELTEEEQQTILDTYQNELDTKVAAINEALVTLKERSVVEKVTAVLTEIDLISDSSSTSTEYVEVRDALELSLELANDIYLFLSLDKEPTEIELPVDNETASSSEGTASSTEEITEEEQANIESASSTSTATSTDITVLNVDTE